MRFLLYDGMPVGGIALGLVLATYAFLGARPDVPLLALVWGGTVVVYQLDRLLGFSPEDIRNCPERVIWVQAHRRYVWATVAVAGGLVLAALPFLRMPTLVAIGALGAVGVAYVTPIWPGKHRLKAVGGLKSPVIAAVWALVAVALPAIEAGASWTTGLVALLAARFFFIWPNVLLADWVDRRGDAQAGIETLATRWPTARLHRVAYGLIGASIGATLLAGIRLGDSLFLLVDAAGPVALALVISRLSMLPRATRVPLLDAVIAWPLITALVAWLTAGL